LSACLARFLACAVFAMVTPWEFGLR
jgi:hypothetical protein